MFDTRLYDLCFDDKELNAILREVKKNPEKYYWDSEDTDEIAVERYIEMEIRGHLRDIKAI